MNPWIWLAPLILAGWLAAGTALALLIGPAMALNTQGPAPEDRSDEEGPW